MSSAVDKMRTNLEKYKQNASSIREDWTRSNEAKRIDLRTAYTEARTRYDELVRERRQVVQDRLDKTRREAFKAPSLPGADKASLLTSYRDALHRADDTIEPKKLSEMLTRSVEIGDSIMSKAILRRAYELPAPSLVGEYFGHYPDEQRTWDAFMDAARESNELTEIGGALGVGAMAPEMPPELANQNAYAGGMGGS